MKRLLAWSSLGCLLLLALRIAYTGSGAHIWLSWNLMLAWVPVLLAPAVRRAAARRRGRWLAPLLGALWLLFYPNALYIVTDLMHLSASGASTLRFWLDLVLVLSFVWMGLLTGYVSLAPLHEWVAATRGRVAGWLFALGVLGLSGFGVYLGRFLRWNSWDIFVQPLALGRDVLAPLLHPLANLQALAITAAFATFFVLVYVSLYTAARRV
jgi:uncharacterized membrane protein